MDTSRDSAANINWPQRCLARRPRRWHVNGSGQLYRVNLTLLLGDTVPPNPDHGFSPELHQAIINSGKKGRAEASFWFHGATTNGTVRLIYVLKLFGKFEDGKDWPGAQTLKMTTWELKVENEGKTIKEMSCQSDGVKVGSVTITVE